MRYSVHQGQDSRQLHTAIILPGAVAKGAYEAGVIYELAQDGTRVDRIVATSSGALNGVAYAAGVRQGRATEMAARLVEAWIDVGGWQDAFTLNPLNWISGRGLSDRRGLLRMLHHLIEPSATSAKCDVQLRIIVTPLQGVRGAIGKMPATTYEKLICFEGPDLDTAEDLAKVFDVTTAACAFPGIYAPVTLPGLGPCIDGGATNNAPIAYGLAEGDVSRIIMPVPFPAIMPDPGLMHGFNMINHMVEILINERLYRDLKDAEVVNREVARIEALVATGVLDETQAKAVKDALAIRTVQITEIRPSAPLKGGSFSGFFSQAERRRLVDEGRKAAREAIDRERQAGLTAGRAGPTHTA